MHGRGAPPLAILLKAANLLTDPAAARSAAYAPRALGFLGALWRLGTLGMIVKLR